MRYWSHWPFEAVDQRDAEHPKESVEKIHRRIGHLAADEALNPLLVLAASSDELDLLHVAVVQHEPLDLQPNRFR